MQRKKVLVLSFFPAFYPPRSGGELRLYNIYKNLSKYYNITILSFTYPGSGEKYQKYTLSPDLVEIRIPKSKIHDLMHHVFYKYGHIIESSGIAVSIASHFIKNYKNILNKLIEDSDIIISTHPYLFKSVDNKFVIYESYNMEYYLQKKALGSSIIARILSWYVYRIEKKACLSSDMVFTVSEEDMNDFYQIYNVSLNKIFLAPNGVDLKEIIGSTVSEKDMYKAKLNLNSNKTLLFIGSAHPPNVNAAKIIINNLAPSMLEFTFLIAGKVSDYFFSNRNEVNELDEKDVENYLSNSEKSVLLTHGWYPLEYWNGIATRWTKERFGFAARDAGIFMIFFKAYSLKEASVNVHVNDMEPQSMELKPGIWGYHEFEFDSVDKVLLNVEVCRTTRESGGDRILGIALQEIGYDSQKIRKKISLSESYEMKVVRSNIPNNVKILGLVDEETKKTLLKASDAALNPQTYGSGTNLKMLEYLAAGLPIITTPIGARGINIINNTHAIICEVEEFKTNILTLFTDETINQKLIQNGKKLAEEMYDWTKITEKMHEDIEMCYEKKNVSS